MTSPMASPVKSEEAVPNEGRRERRKRELRLHIYQVALDLFLSGGFAATTVEEIAAAADVAPATFFNHFKNKQAVLDEATNDVMSHLEEILERTLAQPGGTRERLLGFADVAAADIEEARSIAREVVLTMIRSEPSAGDSAAGEPAPYLARLYDPFAALLRQGQQRGEVRQDWDADFLAEMVIGMFNAPITVWLGHASHPIEKRLRQAAEFAWEAIQLRDQPPAEAST